MPATPRRGETGTSVYNLTSNDSKILGRITQQRKEKTRPQSQYDTRMYKNLHSNWTPILHKPANEQIFKERSELVCNWFDLWTDSQRKRFLDQLFRHCKRSQLYFIWHWFDERVPLRHVDFTKILPRYLCLYIFSFLDPRSLCRAAMVSWNWKFFTDQDDVWTPKCIRQGWYLPYTPASNEYGAWKKHYVACIKTLDVDILSKNPNALYGTMGDGRGKKLRKKTQKLSEEESAEVLTARPAWKDPDAKPKDLEMADVALRHDFNPNEPKSDMALSLYHDKFGIRKKNPMRQSIPEYGLNTTARKDGHRSLGYEVAADLSRRPDDRPLLSEKLELERYEEHRLIELVKQPWEGPPARRKHAPLGASLSGGGNYPVPYKHGSTTQSISKSFPDQEHPRVIFISSRVPAADILVDAVMFGIIPIVYEYEGTTLESLWYDLEQRLQGRTAQSIGIFTHSEIPDQLLMVHGSSVTLDNLDEDEFREFFINLSTKVRPTSEQGHVDLFAPLSSTVGGEELLVQLNILTGMVFSSPTGLVGNYNHIDSDWLHSPENIPPPRHYFCPSKINVWANLADQVSEACNKTREVVGRYFEQKHKDLICQVTGQIVFDAMGQGSIQGVKDLTHNITHALLSLSREQNVKDPVDYVGKYLTDVASSYNRGTTFLTDGNDDMHQGQTLQPQHTINNPNALSQYMHTLGEEGDDYEDHRDSNKYAPDEKDAVEEVESLAEDVNFDGSVAEEDNDEPLFNMNNNNNNNGDADDFNTNNNNGGDLNTNNNNGDDELNTNNNHGDDEAEMSREYHPRGNKQVHYSQETMGGSINSSVQSPRKVPVLQGSYSEHMMGQSINQSTSSVMSPRRAQVEQGSYRQSSFKPTASVTSPRKIQTIQGTYNENMNTRRSLNYPPTSAYSDHLNSTTQSMDTYFNETNQSLQPATMDLSNAHLQLTTTDLRDESERRKAIAKEVVASERAYVRTLEIINTEFFLPLKNALHANRAVLSTHNMQIVFTDVLALLELHRRVVKEVTNRVSDWNPDQCIGDIFLKFTGSLKAYVNFLNNYPVILQTLERSLEQVPLFRAFLKRHERTPQTKMLSLAELLLSPARRINEYVKLLKWFERNTPADHADQGDLKLALKALGDLDNLIRAVKQRGERERELIDLQKKILNSPYLLESNRFFITQLDVAHLKPPADDISPEQRIYQHIETYGLYLFNDGLVITRRTIRNFPFDRAVEQTYRFDSCVALTRLRVQDIPDSKYMSNVFSMYTPKRRWYCATDTSVEKVNWITRLEATIRAALEV